MSKYTTQVRFICESTLQNKGVDISDMTVDDIIAQSLNDIFNFTFPIYDISYKPILLHNILRHFYTKEIGCETVGRWKLFLNDKMNLIMPKYNMLYQSEIYKLDPLSNISEIEKLKRDTTGESTNKIKSDNTQEDKSLNKMVYSDTPQGRLSNLDYATTLNEENNENKEVFTGLSNEEQKILNHESYIRERVGITGVTISGILNEFVSKFKSIDNLIINELDDLFMNIW